MHKGERRRGGRVGRSRSFFFITELVPIILPSSCWFCKFSFLRNSCFVFFLIKIHWPPSVFLVRFLWIDVVVVVVVVVLVVVVVVLVKGGGGNGHGESGHAARGIVVLMYVCWIFFCSPLPVVIVGILFFSLSLANCWMLFLDFFFWW